MTTPKFQQKYRVPSARATWHDYNGGMYFVTICTKDKIGYFGKVVDGKMWLNGLGKFAETCITDVSNHFPDTEIPVFVIMPNHLHAIVCIDGEMGINAPHRRDAACHVSKMNDGNDGDAACHVSTLGQPKNIEMQTIAKKCGRLSAVVGGIKSAITRYANQHQIPFAWQTRFHDHIIRDQSECNRIADYIDHNPETWINDTFYNEENN